MHVDAQIRSIVPLIVGEMAITVNRFAVLGCQVGGSGQTAPMQMKNAWEGRAVQIRQRERAGEVRLPAPLRSRL